MEVPRSPALQAQTIPRDRGGTHLVLVIHQVAQHVVRVQDPPVTVLHMVGPNQEVTLLRAHRK